MLVWAKTILYFSLINGKVVFKKKKDNKVFVSVEKLLQSSRINSLFPLYPTVKLIKTVVIMKFR